MNAGKDAAVNGHSHPPSGGWPLTGPAKSNPLVSFHSVALDISFLSLSTFSALCGGDYSHVGVCTVRPHQENPCGIYSQSLGTRYRFQICTRRRLEHKYNSSTIHKIKPQGRNILKPACVLQGCPPFNGYPQPVFPFRTLHPPLL